MKKRNLFSVGIFRKSLLSENLSYEVLISYKVVGSRPYLCAGDISPSNYWWKRYLTRKSAERTAERVVTDCAEVVASFTFDPDTKATLRCWYRENGQVVPCEEAQLKAFLNENFGITWKK